MQEEMEYSVQPLLPKNIRQKPVWRVNITYFITQENETFQQEGTFYLVSDDLKKAVGKAQRVVEKIRTDGRVMNIQITAINQEISNAIQ